MSWSTAINDLRIVLSDGPTDKLAWRKNVFPAPNGTFSSFKTFEFRRVTDFKNCNAPLGVFVEGVRAANTEFSADDLDSGEFTFATPPAAGSEIQCTYYTQWFTDEELNVFLTIASDWLGLGSNYQNMPEGLRPSAKKFASAEGYQKMAARFSQTLADTYKVQDQKSPETEPTIQSFWDMAKICREEASKLRDDYYTRQGQSLAPNNQSIFGKVRTLLTRN